MRSPAESPRRRRRRRGTTTRATTRGDDEGQQGRGTTRDDDDDNKAESEGEGDGPLASSRLRRTMTVVDLRQLSSFSSRLETYAVSSSNCRSVADLGSLPCWRSAASRIVWSEETVFPHSALSPCAGG